MAELHVLDAGDEPPMTLPISVEPIHPDVYDYGYSVTLELSAWHELFPELDCLDDGLRERIADGLSPVAARDEPCTFHMDASEVATVFLAAWNTAVRESGA